MVTESVRPSDLANANQPTRRQSFGMWLDRHAFTVMLMPAIIVLLALGVFPFIYSLLLSFHDWNMADRTAGWNFVGFANYAKILTSDPLFRDGLRATAIFVGAGVTIEMVFGVAIALLLNRDYPGRGLVRTLIILPAMITPVVVGLIWRFMYNPDRGIINYLLGLIGIQGLDWLGRANTAMPAVILVDVWEWTPFVALIVLAALQSLDREPLEAAVIDGASNWQRFRFVIYPMILPAILVALLIRLMDSFKTFDIIYVLTLGGPGATTQVLSLYTYKYGFKFFQMGYAAALAYIMVIIVIVLANVFIRGTRRQ
jgi:multiple sugar transport system permease protein